VLAGSVTWLSNMRRRWDYSSAQSTSTTASWPMPRALVPISLSMPRLEILQPPVKKATGGGAQGVLITAPSLIAFKQGVSMTRKRGTCILVGLPPGEFPVPLFDVVANCITIRGSFVGSRQDMAESPRLRCRRQGQGRYRVAAAIVDQPDLRPPGARRCAVARGSRLHAS